MAQSLSTLNQIAAKRLSGKAMTSAITTLAGEKFGSTVQTLNSTVFGEVIPNNPNNTWATYQYLIQSESNSDPGTVMLIEFELRPDADSAYDNDSYDDTNNDAGENPFGDITEGPSSTAYDNTYHAYHLRLPDNFETQISQADFDTNASTPVGHGTGKFTNSYHLSASRGTLQVVPEYASNIAGGSNPYKPYIVNTNGTQLVATSTIDWYLDTYAGILFIQDPISWDGIDGGGSITGTPNNNDNIPDKIRAFVYVGKLQNEITFTSSDVNFIVSGSNEGFTVNNEDTINFVSGSAGITVLNNGTDTITIGASTDNVTFNNITASIINADKIEATEYIVSSSITYMTQSFSSGSTIFGDTNDDTHQFTGSISILHTGSGYGFELSGSSINIDAGSSGSLTLGTHNVGIDIVSLFPITGSGLIISQSNLPTYHYNMVKIGNVELLDYTGVSGDGFLIDTKDRSFIISSSDASKPLVQFKSGDTRLYNGDGNTVTQIGPTNSTFGTGQNSSTTTVQGVTTYLGGSTTTHIRVHEGTPGNNNNDTDTAHVLFSVGKPNVSFADSQNKIESTPLNTLFTYLGGAVTASAVSSSGLLFAGLSGNPTHNDGILTVVYDTGSGQFYYTGSYGAGGGGDTTDLEASASQGIYFWTGSGTGTSIGLMQTASFTSSGAGLSVDLDETTNTFTYTLTPQDVFDAFNTANTGSFTASYANTASKVAVERSYESEKLSLIFVSGASEFDTTNTVHHQLKAANSLYYNSADEQLTLDGTFVPTVLVVSSSTAGVESRTTIGVNYIQGENLGATQTTYNLINNQKLDGTSTLNFGGRTTTINVGSGSGVVNFNNDIAVAGSASIEGDLIIKGAVTSINTTQLNVEDQFILLNSGSTTGDGGIIIQTSNVGGPNGPALYLDSTYGRFAVKKGMSWDQTGTVNVDETTEFLVTVSSSNTNPNSNPQWYEGGTPSYGQMFVNTQTGDFFIYG